MTYGTWILLGVLVLAIIWILTQGKKKRWYDIYMANGEPIRGYRKMSDWWFRDIEGFTSYRLPDGRVIKVSKHFTIKVEEVGEKAREVK
jgi:hypothetical protein